MRHSCRWLLVVGAAVTAVMTLSWAARADFISSAGGVPDRQSAPLHPQDLRAIDLDANPEPAEVTPPRPAVADPMRIDGPANVVIPRSARPLSVAPQPLRGASPEPRPITLEPVPSHLVPEPASLG